MDLGVQWFCTSAIDQNLLTKEICIELRDVLGDEAELLSFAQAVLDHQLCDDLEAIQQVMNDAHTKAQQGLAPEYDVFADAGAATEAAVASAEAEEQAPAPAPVRPSGSLGDIPSLDGVETMSDEDAAALMEKLLSAARNVGASDLHLSCGTLPFIRLNLMVHKLTNSQALTPEAALKLNTCLLSAAQKTEFEEEGDLDIALALDKSNRFRVNLMKHKQGAAGTYRMIPNSIRTLEQLGFRNHKTINKFLDHHNGLILVTGPVGSGKTTTLAALVDTLNQKRKDHIITVENPIEIVQYSKNCNITQREVGSHTASFASALKGALREDPDIIVIGELRDLETIEMAITAAETGHLVIGTLHTNDAGTTLNRLLDVFPPDQQQQIRAMTAESLRGIVCQKLVPAEGGGLAVALEILINTIAIANNIRENKTHQLKAILQTGIKQGMCMMDQSILEMWQEKIISDEVALLNLEDRQFINQVKQGNAPPPEAEGEADDADAGDTKKKKKGWFR